MRLCLAILVFYLSFLGAVSLNPALSQQVKAQKAMEFTLVRSNDAGCEPSCAEWIAAQGQIVAGSSAGLERLIRSLKGRKLPILIHSNGGDVGEGLRMGQIIRNHGLDVMVAETLPDVDCPANDAHCLKQMRLAKGPKLSYFNFNRALCASACTFVLAGGVRRVAMNGVYVGVHQVTATQTRRIVYRRFYVERRRINGRWVEVSRRQISERLISQKTIKLKSAPESTNQRIEAHFKKMGLDPAFFALTLSTPAESIRYLSQSEIHAQRVGTHVVSDILNVRPGSPRPKVDMAKSPPVVFPSIASLTSKDETSPSPKPDLPPLLPQVKPQPFSGVLTVGILSAELTIEPNHPHNSAIAFLRLMFETSAIRSEGNRVILNFFENDLKIHFAPADEGHASRPMISRFDLAKLCSIDSESQMTISHRQAPINQLRSMQIASVAELLPWVGIKAALCPK